MEGLSRYVVPQVEGMLLLRCLDVYFDVVDCLVLAFADQVAAITLGADMCDTLSVTCIALGRRRWVGKAEEGLVTESMDRWRPQRNAALVPAH